MYNRIISALWRAWAWVDTQFNKVYPQDYNPMYYLGGLANLVFWMVISSGILLFLYYKPSLLDAYNSVEYLSTKVPYGQAMRGVHRYSADVMVIWVLLHFLRVWLTDRYRKFRSLAWISGIVLMTLTFMIGVTGYLLVWDERSLLLTRMTQWMLGGEQSYLGQLLVGGTEITDGTLNRFLFFHIGMPFLMLFFLWMHYIRINRPIVYPPAPLTLQIFGVIFITCGFVATKSMAPAVIEVVPQGMDIDWFFQWGYVAAGWLASTLGPTAGISPYVIWLVLITVAVCLLFALPYYTQTSYMNVVKVIPEKCTGCEYCYVDCHANAIRMIFTPGGINSKGGKGTVAEILPTRCAECGICVGACPFGAIELPQLQEPEIQLRIDLISNIPAPEVATTSPAAD